MLDKKTELMLQVADELTADDLDQIRKAAPLVLPGERVAVSAPLSTSAEETAPVGTDNDVHRSVPADDPARGERERQRTRESKIATTCTGQERRKHSWWPLGTRLVGRVGSEVFTGTVVENPQVKSGRSLQITSGPAAGRVCITPTRAALEATEAYRQTHNLGRGGGVTNGWTFWQPEA